MADRLRKLPDEFTLQQWLRRPTRLARRVLACDCWKEGLTGHSHAVGFRCRGRGSCGRYCCACVGGSEPGAENLCAACANKLTRALTKTPKAARKRNG